MTMRAISLWQPWASLIAAGIKRYETRDWAPPRALIGQTIAIHAAKKIDRNAGDFADQLMYFSGRELSDKLGATWRGADGDFDMGNFGEATVMPIGCVVAIARLDAAFKLGCTVGGNELLKPAARVVQCIASREGAEVLSGYVQYDEYGDYSPGRWAWLLADVRAVNPPVRARGAQGFFTLPEGWLG